MRGPSGNASAVYDYNESDEDFDARTQQVSTVCSQDGHDRSDKRIVR